MTAIIATVIVTQIALIVWGFITWNICKRRFAKAEWERAGIVTSNSDINASLDETEERVIHVIRKLREVKHSLPHCDSCHEVIKYSANIEVFTVEDTFYDRDKGIGKIRVFCCKGCMTSYRVEWDSKEDMRTHYDDISIDSIWSDYQDALGYKPTKLKQPKERV